MTVTSAPEKTKVETTTLGPSRGRRCTHPGCGGNLYLVAHDEEYGRTPCLYVLCCLQCGRREAHPGGYYTRRYWHRRHGIPYADLDEVARGRAAFVWEAACPHEVTPAGVPSLS